MTSNGEKNAGQPDREDRLAARLRDNLKKRKEQARLRRETPDSADAVSDAPDPAVSS